MANYFCLENWTTLTITGSDRAAWLHNLCTNAVRDLPAGSGCEAFVTDVKGKTLGHVFVLVDADAMWVVTTPNQASVLKAHCERYIIREDVTLADESEKFEWTLVVLDDAGSADAISFFATARLLTGAWQHRLSSHPYGDVRVANASALAPNALLVGAPRSNQTALIAELSAAEISGLDQAGFDSVRVAAGWPLFGVDFDQHNLPQEVNRNDQALSFTKGCYLGQETVARIDALGRVNKLLTTVAFAAGSTPSSGIELTHDGKAVGSATTIGQSTADRRPRGLAMLQRDATTEGTTLQSDAGPAEVVG